MSSETYKKVRALVAVFVGITVSTAVTQNSYFLAIIGVVTGMLFMALARSKAKIVIDERDKTIREKSAQLAYAIFVPVIGLGSVAAVFVGRKMNMPELSFLGTTLSYLTLLLIATYSIAYYFVNRVYGGGGDEA